MELSPDAKIITDMLGVHLTLKWCGKKKKMYIPAVPSEYMLSVLGQEYADKICDAFGGTAVNIPTKRLENSLRNKSITRLHSLGENIKRLTDYCKLSEQSIYKIVKQSKTQKSKNGGRG